MKKHLTKISCLVLSCLVLSIDQSFGATINCSKNTPNCSGTTSGDTIYGTSGFNLIKGNSGKDTLYGKADNDTLYGGNYNETDTLSGGTGGDTFVVNVLCTQGKERYAPLPSSNILDFNAQEGDRITFSMPNCQQIKNDDDVGVVSIDASKDFTNGLCTINFHTYINYKTPDIVYRKNNIRYSNTYINDKFTVNASNVTACTSILNGFRFPIGVIVTKK